MERVSGTGCGPRALTEESNDLPVNSLYRSDSFLIERLREITDSVPLRYRRPHFIFVPGRATSAFSRGPGAKHLDTHTEKSISRRDRAYHRKAP